MNIELTQKCPNCAGDLVLTAETATLVGDGEKTDVLIACQGECEQIWNDFLALGDMMTLNNPELP